MSQTNTNTNNGSGNTNWNQISGRTGRGQGGSGGRGRGGCKGNYGDNVIAKYLFKGKMKDCCVSKMIITEIRHPITQYKKIIDTLPVLYADKNYRYINDVLCTWIDLDKADFTPLYPNIDQWSNTYNVEIKTVNPLRTPDQGTDKRPPVIVVSTRTYIFDANL